MNSLRLEDDAHYMAVASGGPSLRLRAVARLFHLVGGAGLLATAVAIVTIVSAGESLRELTQRPLALAVAVGTCISFLATGSQLLRRSRRAGVTAAVTFAWPVLSALVGPGMLTGGTLLLGAGGVALLASVWSELEG